MPAAPAKWAIHYLDILGLVGGDELISLVDLGRPPVANPLEQAAESAVEGGLACEQKRDPVAAGLDLRALAGPALRQGDRLPEAF